MYRLRYLFIGLLSVLLFSSFTAPKEKSDEIKRVYLYGVSHDFNDSVVYMTDIQCLDSMTIKADGSLQNHSSLSLQMKYFLEGMLQKGNQTCAVIYSDDKRKLEKRYVKMRKRYQSDNHKVLMKLNSESFTFRKE